MKVILAHGVFDLLHSGHVAHLLQARAFGDSLIVSVIADKFVKKGHKVINDERERVFMVGALACVDRVILCQAPGPQDILESLKPTMYVRNDEYIAQDKPEYALCKQLGIAVGFTRTFPQHTTSLAHRIMEARGYEKVRPRSAQSK
jgi:cytidyltransferase-like protein